MHNEVLSFWFEEIEAKMWFASNEHFDNLIRQRFSGVLAQAAAGELYSWRATVEGRLAEIIVLDQFSRNVYRYTAQTFTQDTIALVLAQEAISAGALQSLDSKQCGFLLMPYMHSESKQIHAVAETLFKNYASAGSYEYELRHKAIIDRFGRYPHRNEILGRTSTSEELEFLSTPGSRF